MPDIDPTPQEWVHGWVQGWALIKGQPPHRECAGVYETRAEAEQAAETAGEGYQTLWGRYNERTKEFVGGTIGV